MASDLLTYLMEEKLAELKTEQQSKIAELEAELGGKIAELEAELGGKIAELEAEKEAAIDQFQHAIEESVIARFPDAPIALVHDIRHVTDPQQLQQLIVTVIRAADLAEFERALAQAVSHP